MNKVNEWYFNNYKRIIESPSGKQGRLEFELVNDAIFTEKYFISLTSSYPQTINNRNIVCYSDEAKLIWQVEGIPETSSSNCDKYIEFRGFIDNETIVMAFNWNHWLVGIDITGGRIMTKLDTLPEWKVDRNIIICPNDKHVNLPFEIMSYDKVGEDLLVLLEPPSNVLMPDNVFMVSHDGFIKWQIGKNGKTDNDMTGFYNSYCLSPYNDTIRLFTYSGFVICVDIRAGKILQIEWNK